MDSRRWLILGGLFLVFFVYGIIDHRRKTGRWTEWRQPWTRERRANFGGVVANAAAFIAVLISVAVGAEPLVVILVGIAVLAAGLALSNFVRRR